MLGYDSSWIAREIEELSREIPGLRVTQVLKETERAVIYGDPRMSRHHERSSSGDSCCFIMLTE